MWNASLVAYLRMRPYEPQRRPEGLVMTLAQTSDPPTATASLRAADGPAPRFAHVVTRYLRGGSERRVCDIVRALPEVEHHLFVGAESDVDLAREQVRCDSLTVLPSLVRRPHPFHDPSALAGLVRILRRDRYDLIVTHQSKAGVLGRAAARVTGIGAVHCLSMPSFGPGYPSWQSRMFRFLEQRLEHGTHAFAVVGHDVARRYRDIGIPDEKLHVVRSGVRLPERTTPISDREIRRRHGLPADRPLVLYLGSLEQRKNVLDLPRVLAELVRSSPDRPPFLVIAGEGPLGSRLQDGLERAGVADSAACLGFVDDPLSLVGIAGCVVLLSTAEGVPQVLVQAAALGTPFVAYAVDGVAELLELGADGVSVEPGDVDAATAATLAILRGAGRPRGLGIDLASWQPHRITEDYREVFTRVLAPTLAASSPKERIPSHV